MSTGFIKQNRSDEVLEMLKDGKNHDAFILLNVIALRAKRTSCFSHDIEIGEALLGDHQNYGMTLQRYRTAKQKLEKWKFATFRTTSKGTIAKLSDDRVWDVNLETNINRSTSESTLEQQASNKRATTNKNERMEERGFGDKSPHPLHQEEGGRGRRKGAFVYEGTISEQAVKWHERSIGDGLKCSADIIQQWIDDYGIEPVRETFMLALKEKREGKKIGYPYRYIGAILSNDHKLLVKKII